MNPTQKPPPDHGEEVELYDEALLGKAVRISAIVLFIIIATAGFVYLLARKKPAPPSRKIIEIKAPVAQQFSGAKIPEAKFVNITSAAGITFTHNNGAVGGKLLPETMGSGAGFFDYDNDGAEDLLLINGTFWPGKTPQGQKQTTAALYHNDGTGHFTDVTAGSGLDVPIYGMAPAFGDFDNDGLVDVFITGVGGNHLFKNFGAGKFQEVTEAAGVGGRAGEWSTAACWFDMDNDGDLDLFVGNYIRWSPEIDSKVGWTLVGIGRAYGQPKDFEGTYPYLYRNEGNGKFSDISKLAGIEVKNPATGVPAAKTLGVTAIDIDNDGYLDLIVANDTVPNLLFQNQRDGTFKEIGAASGIAFDSFGATRGAMGIDAARYRDDGALGVAIGNFANEMTALYVSQPAASSILFTDEALTEGIGAPSRLPLKFGIFFFDLDLDGRLDLLSANGHLEQEISKIQKSQQYRQPAQIFWNSGPTPSGSFAPATSSQMGSDLFEPIVGRGSAYADIDGDGDLDVILTQNGGAPLLLRNDQNLGHHFIRLKLVGTKSNRDAIGAWVHARIDGKEIWRNVTPTRSYLSQSELPVTIGLGNGSKIDQLEIIWPGGKKQLVHAELDKPMKITEAE